ncbi:MFS transporter [Isoptericola dokdonensis]|uniref:Antiseptic resistance protein n=1 Tax=Isoptericola dokdonensis DS-3 TaxID=1300344 RepID=A0A168FCE7_9MICO|nr:MFS transporter [Isoptericola dokdonensis]ANC31346.1 Antiseptic resistance protein [Isoptericola dokdonensis DS-3]
MSTTSGPAGGAGPGTLADGVARRPGMAIFALTVAGVAQAADVSLHNTALASAAAELGMSATQRSIAASIGTLALAASILTIGTVGDRYGRRLTLMWCAVALVAGGVITAVAPSYAVYLGGRVVTGVGLAGTLALSIALIRTVAPDRIPWAMSMYFAGQVGFTLPLTILGGWLIGVDWRLGYLVVPVVGVAAFVLNKLFVPRSKAVHRSKADPVGLVLVAVALVGIIWGVSDAAHGWLSVRVLVPVLVGLAALVAFLWWETHHDEPALPVKLFTNRSLAGALTADVSFNMWQAVMVLQLSLLWQYVYSYSPLDVTIGQLPATLAMIVGAFAAGRLGARGRRPESLVLVGLAGVALAMYLLAVGGASTPYWVFAVALVVGGFSRMLTETAAGEFFVQVPPPDLVGATVASKPAIGQASFALGSAFSSTLLYSGLGRDLPDRIAELGLTPSEQGTVTGWFAEGAVPTWAQGTDLYEQVLAVSQDAYVDAYRTTMLVFAVVFTVLWGVAWHFLRRRA